MHAAPRRLAVAIAIVRVRAAVVTLLASCLVRVAVTAARGLATCGRIHVGVIAVAFVCIGAVEVVAVLAAGVVDVAVAAARRLAASCGVRPASVAVTGRGVAAVEVVALFAGCAVGVPVAARRYSAASRAVPVAVVAVAVHRVGLALVALLGRECAGGLVERVDVTIAASGYGAVHIAERGLGSAVALFTRVGDAIAAYWLATEYRASGTIAVVAFLACRGVDVAVATPGVRTIGVAARGVAPAVVALFIGGAIHDHVAAGLQAAVGAAARLAVAF